MAINKVVYNENTLIDLTDLNVTAGDVIQGIQAIDKAGNKIAGTLQIQKYYTGASEPSSSLGNDGDIYLQE